MLNSLFAPVFHGMGMRLGLFPAFPQKLGVENSAILNTDFFHIAALHILPALFGNFKIF